MICRNNLKGSWFVQCLCRVFMKYSASEDLDTLLLRVTQELKAYCTTRGEKQINETLLRGVTRKLYFNPGLTNATNQASYLTTPVSPTPASASSVCLNREATLEVTGLTRATDMMFLDDVWSGLGGAEMGQQQCKV